ncbi:MAG: hypothetical protein ACOCUT_03365 [bacterium]
MKKFIGGEIKENSRGSLALILVESYQSEPLYSKHVVPHLEPLDSLEYLSLTDPESSNDDLLRAYLGVNEASCLEILSEIKEPSGDVRALSRLKAYDMMLVKQGAVVKSFF